MEFPQESHEGFLLCVCVCLVIHRMTQSGGDVIGQVTAEWEERSTKASFEWRVSTQKEERS